MTEGNQTEAHWLEYNDISILWPIPDAGKEDLLVGLADPSKQSELLSKELFDMAVTKGGQAPKVIPENYASLIGEYDRWRVVSARFDACYVEQLPKVPCTPMLRVVAQPLFLDNEEGEQIGDAALQLIYEVKDPKAVAKGLLDIKRRSPVSTSGDLTVHPGLKHSITTKSNDYAPGFAVLFSSQPSDEFAQFVKAALQGMCHTKDLVTINISARVPNKDKDKDRTTLFASFTRNKETGEFASVQIPVLAPPSEHQIVIDNESKSIKTVIEPNAGVADNLGDLDVVRDGGDKDDLLAVVEKALRIENPEKHTMFSTDCVSCHLSTNVVLNAMNRLSSEGITELPASTQKDAYQVFHYGKGNHVKDAKDKQLFSVRNFAYYRKRTEPSISQRTINETDRVMEEARAYAFK